MLLSGKFIQAKREMCNFEQRVAAPYFRKKFVLDFIPETAKLTVCGLGFYELCVNGKNITKGALAPYISNTNDVCYYDCYDVKGELVQGENVIGVLLGNGFQNPFGGFVWEFEKISKPLMLAFALEVQNEEQAYHISLLDEEVSYADLVREQDVMATEIRQNFVKVFKGTPLSPPQSNFFVSGKNVVTSIIKCAEADEGIIVRVFNPSEAETCADIVCSKKMKKAERVNLNEETQEELSVCDNRISIPLAPWKIQTVKLFLM